MNLKEAIEASKKLMLEKKMSGFSPFVQYTKSYFRTNENIQGYLNDLDYNKNRALSILASGDHVFNLIHQGVNVIDTFDINALAYYTFYLRRALMLAFDFYKVQEQEEKFLSVTSSIWNIRDLLLFIKPFMPEDVYLYFEELANFNEFLAENTGEKNLFPYLYRGKNNSHFSNFYNYSEEDYKRVQEDLRSAVVTFRQGDVLSLLPTLTEKYDIILLSNILEYVCSIFSGLDKDKYGAVIKEFQPYLEKDGVLLNYFFLRNAFGLEDMQMDGYDLTYKRIRGLSRDESFQVARRK